MHAAQMTGAARAAPSSASRTVGDVTLSQAGRVLSGPMGSVTIPAPAFSVAWRLLRQPGTLVSPSLLIETLYENPDFEPDNAHTILRIRVMQLRKAIKAVTAGRVEIRTAVSVGYAMEERR